MVLNLRVYEGDTTFPDYTDSDFNLGEKAVLSLTESLVPGSIIFQDRYFTSVKLLEELSKRGIKSTGTLMKNRIPGAIRNSIESDLELKRRGRGSYQTLTRDDDVVSLTKWYDNKPVIILSSIHAANDVDLCKRWCKKDKRYVMVDRPEVIREYNTNMGGVDMADRLLAVCPARARTKKWTTRFISHMFDLSICNAWIEYKNNQVAKGVPKKKIQQLRFYKMELAEQLIDVNTTTEDAYHEPEDEVNTAKKRPGRPGAVPLPSKYRRMHASLHIPEVADHQMRCHEIGCNSRTTITCNYCNVGLCLTKTRNCFKTFHAEE